MKMIDEEKRIRRLLRRLKKSLPPPMPIILKFVEEDEKDIVGCLGLCYQRKNHFLIKIVRSNLWSMCYTLLHEFAHVLYFNEKDFHSEKWGETYSKVWKVYAEET